MCAFGKQYLNVQTNILGRPALGIDSTTMN